MESVHKGSDRPMGLFSSSALLRVPKASKKLDGRMLAAIREKPTANEQEIQLEARIRTLQKRSAAVPSNEELKSMIGLLTQHSTPPHDADDKKINYADFKRVGASVPERCRQFFQASTFLYFQKDEHKRIKIHALCQYIIANVILEQAWISVSLYDGDHDERLTEDDMNRYVSEFLDTVPTVRDYVSASPLLRNVYVLTIVRKFFFFLDPLGTGAIRIRTLIMDPMFKELDFLRKSEGMLPATSWFHLDHTNRMYKKFRNLDADGNGKLGEDDLRGYDPPLTNSFIAQLLTTKSTADGELDFRDFLNLELAVANPTAPRSVRYFFSIFDLDQKGYIIEHDLAFFLKDVLEGLDETLELEPGEEEFGSGKVFAADVMNQIFDLIRSKHPRVITLDDLITSGAAHIFTSILSSRDLFDNWEHNDGLRINYHLQRGPPSPPLPPHRVLAFYHPEGSSAAERWPEPPAPPALAVVTTDA